MLHDADAGSAGWLLIQQHGECLNSSASDCLGVWAAASSVRRSQRSKHECKVIAFTGGWAVAEQRVPPTYKTSSCSGIRRTVLSSCSEISSPGRTHMTALSPFCRAEGNCSARARFRRASTSILLPAQMEGQ